MNESQTPPAVKTPRDPALDGLRGIAILLVYLFHYGGGLKSPSAAVRILGYISSAGWIGVILFLALSGYLITGQLWQSLRTPHWLRNFFARRALRIFPVYYLCVAIILVVLLAAHRTAHQTRDVYVYALFLQDLPWFASRGLEIPSPLPLYHLWTIAVEEQFYLFWPFLLLLARDSRQALRLCLGAFAASLLFNAVVFGLPQVPPTVSVQFGSFLLTYAGPLALGSALALSLHRAEPSRAQRLTATPRAGIAFLLGLGVFLTTSLASHTLTLSTRLQYLLGLPAISLAAVAAVALVLQAGAARRFCSLAPLRLLGRISYGFYLFHVLLDAAVTPLARHLAHNTTGSLALALRFILGFPITFVAAWLSFHFLETPFLKLKRYFAFRPREFSL